MQNYDWRNIFLGVPGIWGGKIVSNLIMTKYYRGAHGCCVLAGFLKIPYIFFDKKINLLGTYLWHSALDSYESELSVDAKFVFIQHNPKKLWVGEWSTDMFEIIWMRHHSQTHLNLLLFQFHWYILSN